MKIIEKLLQSLRSASVFNPEVQVAPACILWPDQDRQWEAAIPRLLTELPELLVHGTYLPGNRTGPAIWLRCAIAQKIDEVTLPNDCVPILYLPGISRQDLRAVENCPDHLKPLVELQYRGSYWSQFNSKDWTILAFLKSKQGGLGLDIAQDNDTKIAMQLSLCNILDEDIENLKGKRLDKNFFNTLLTGGDPIRELLLWLNQHETFRKNQSGNQWKAFISVCESQFEFNPEKEGVLSGAEKLATHQGSWRDVWDRFREAPNRYPNIPLEIRKCTLPQQLDWHSNDKSYDGWPQWNDSREKKLRGELNSLKDLPIHDVRKNLIDLEKQHNHRRTLIWAELEEAPLAMALEHLSMIAEITSNSLAAGTIEDISNGYLSQGWRADDAVLKSLSQIEKDDDFEAIVTAIRSIYLPWIEDASRHLQNIWDTDIHGLQRETGIGKKESDNLGVDKTGVAKCYFFVDGLRFDCGKRLVKLLEEKGCIIQEKPVWAPLPTLTGTGKPAVAPINIYDELTLEPDPNNFEPITSYNFKKLLREKGWFIIDREELRKLHSHFFTVQNTWVEYGDIDHEGHNMGWKLAKKIDEILIEIRDRIMGLLETGWESITVVTDHGWLLFPGGLPKADLPKALSENKWGRCAIMKEGAKSNERLFPWYWNPAQYFALADGINCFHKGLEYSHGGLSLQECLTLELTITRGNVENFKNVVSISEIIWRGLRCTISVKGQFPDLIMDIRSHANDNSSSVVKTVNPIEEDGRASVLVVDYDNEFGGAKAFIVLLDGKGNIIAQAPTIIGGEN